MAALVTTSGGLVGGDRIDVAASVDDGAAAVVTAQAAEKVYRSTGPDCHIAVTLRAAAGSWLEWLPQETILFDGARLRRTVRIDCAPTGRVLAGEFLVLGPGGVRRAADARAGSGGVGSAPRALRSPGRMRCTWTVTLPPWSLTRPGSVEPGPSHALCTLQMTRGRGWIWRAGFWPRIRAACAPGPRL